MRAGTGLASPDKALAENCTGISETTRNCCTAGTAHAYGLHVIPVADASAAAAICQGCRTRMAAASPALPFFLSAAARVSSVSVSRTADSCRLKVDADKSFSTNCRWTGLTCTVREQGRAVGLGRRIRCWAPYLIPRAKPASQGQSIQRERQRICGAPFSRLWRAGICAGAARAAS